MQGMAGHPYDKAMAEYHAFEHLRDAEGWDARRFAAGGGGRQE